MCCMYCQNFSNKKINVFDRLLINCKHANKIFNFQSPIIFLGYFNILLQLIMLNRYSVVIHPNVSIINRFKLYKNTLFSKIGNYGSRDSMAHITILEFDATEKELENIIKKLYKIVQEEISFDAIFNQVIYSQTILVLPDNDGNEYFKKLLETVRARIKGIQNNSIAHLTIGRNLKPEQVANLQNLFHDANFNFHCNQLALRKFNDNIKQYEIVQIFPFSGNDSKKEIMQLSLF